MCGHSQSIGIYREPNKQIWTSRHKYEEINERLQNEMPIYLFYMLH